MAINRNFNINIDNFINDIKNTKNIVKDYKFKNNNTLIVKSEVDIFGDAKQWENTLINTFSFNTERAISQFSFLFPENNKDKVNNEAGLKTPFYKIESVFNYYTDYYDDIGPDNESQLFSFYFLYRNEQNKNYENLFSLPENRKIQRELFSNFSYNYTNDYIFKTAANSKLSSNVLFGADYNFTKYYDKLKQVPIYNKLSFSHNVENSIFKNHLNKAMLLEHFICNILHTNPITETSLDSDNNPVSIRYFPVSPMINNFKNYSSNKVILSAKNLGSISSINFLNKVKLAEAAEKAGAHSINYQEIFNNNSCHNEVIFFRIDKYSNSIRGRPIKSYYVTENSKQISILDSQVYADKRYHYVVNAYILVYGAKYSYEVVNSQRIGSFNQYEAEVSVTTRPNLRIYEIEAFRTSGVAAEIPPNRPTVLFSNESNQKNKINIILEQPKCQIEEPFVAISAFDENQADTMISHAAYPGKYKFENKKTQMSYEIYRTTREPTSITDFSNSLIDTIDTEPNSNILITSDTILPDKKYYYMFRANSITGKSSNPSPIYEIFLEKDGGESLLKVNNYNINKKRTLKKSVDFKKLLYITPSGQQRYLDLEDDIIARADSYGKLENYITLGDNLDRKCWNRKFKFRLKSKTTGRIIDFNIKFKINKTTNVEDLN